MSESNSKTGNRNGNETWAHSNLGNGTSTGPPDSELEHADHMIYA